MNRALLRLTLGQVGMQAPKPRYRIHPGIGIARLGNASRPTFFVGPEIPGLPPSGAAPTGTAVPPFKDAGMIKPQAARFRLFEYKKVGGKWEWDREITTADADVVSITWIVHLANVKAAFRKFDGRDGEGPAPAAPRNSGTARSKLRIDPGPRSIRRDGAGAATGVGPIPAPVRFEPGPAPPNQQWPENTAGARIIDYLGELRIDDGGRLLVIGGQGRSEQDQAAGPPRPISNYANNDGWFDDISDGPVRAIVRVKRKQGGVDTEINVEARNGAWVLVGPPDFGPTTDNLTSLYDTMIDVAARQLPLPADERVYDTTLLRLKQLNDELFVHGRRYLTTYTVSFDEDIYPILRRAIDAGSYYEPAAAVHGMLGDDPTYRPLLADPAAAGGAAVRTAIFAKLRRPVGHPPPPGWVQPTGSIPNMPRLLGDESNTNGDLREFYAIPPTQYALMERWARGPAFTTGTLPWPPPLPPATITPAGLDRAALEHCVGGAFFPGIEGGWQLRAAALFAEPFRFNHRATSTHGGDAGRAIGPGHFSRQMALPWQADFLACSVEQHDVPPGSGNMEPFAWWPAQRPDQILTPALARVDWFRPSGPFWDPLAGRTVAKFEDMVKHWYKFGFVLPVGPNLVETDRNAAIP
jgi:L-Lysine epsilon oxidase N-terminal/L-lysine epsilon oxidase C-terminal domain